MALDPNRSYNAFKRWQKRKYGVEQPTIAPEKQEEQKASFWGKVFKPTLGWAGKKILGTVEELREKTVSPILQSPIVKAIAPPKTFEQIYEPPKTPIDTDLYIRLKSKGRDDLIQDMLKTGLKITPPGVKPEDFPKTREEAEKVLKTKLSQEEYNTIADTYKEQAIQSYPSLEDALNIKFAQTSNRELVDAYVQLWPEDAVMRTAAELNISQRVREDLERIEEERRRKLPEFAIKALEWTEDKIDKVINSMTENDLTFRGKIQRQILQKYQEKQGMTPEEIEKGKQEEKDLQRFIFKRAIQDVTVSLLRFEDAEPETYEEQVLAPIISGLAFVGTLAVTKKLVLPHLIKYPSLAKIIKTYPHLSDTFISLGIVGARGQLNPSLGLDFQKRLKAVKDESLALLKFMAIGKTAGTGIKSFPIWAVGSMGLAWLEGASEPEIIGSGILGIILAGTGYFSNRNMITMLKHASKQNLERYSDAKVKRGYTDSDIDFVQAEATKNAMERVKDPVLFDKIQQSITNSAEFLKWQRMEGREFPPFKSEIREMNEALREIFPFLKGKEIKNEIAPTREITQPSEPAQPKLVVDPKTGKLDAILHDRKIKIQIEEQYAKRIAEEGRENYNKFIERTISVLNKTKSERNRRDLEFKLEIYKKVGKDLGFEEPGVRITDIQITKDGMLRRISPSFLQEPLSGLLDDFARIKASKAEKNLENIRKGIDELTEIFKEKSEDLAREILRRADMLEQRREDVLPEAIKSWRIRDLLEGERAEKSPIDIVDRIEKIETKEFGEKGLPERYEERVVSLPEDIKASVEKKTADLEAKKKEARNAKYKMTYEEPVEFRRPVDYRGKELKTFGDLVDVIKGKWKIRFDEKTLDELAGVPRDPVVAELLDYLIRIKPDTLTLTDFINKIAEASYYQKAMVRETVEPILERITDELLAIKDPKERSKAIEKEIREDFPLATDKQITRLKKIVGKMIRGKDYETAVAEVAKKVPEKKPPVEKPIPKPVGVEEMREFPQRVKDAIIETDENLYRALEINRELQGLEVDKLYLIGSFAKGKATIESDVDFVVKFKKPIPKDRIDLVEYEVMKEIVRYGEEEFLEGIPRPPKREAIDIWVVNSEAEIAERFGSPAKIEITDKLYAQITKPKPIPTKPKEVKPVEVKFPETKEVKEKVVPEVSKELRKELDIYKEQYKDFDAEFLGNRLMLTEKESVVRARLKDQGRKPTPENIEKATQRVDRELSPNEMRIFAKEFGLKLPKEIMEVPEKVEETVLPEKAPKEPKEHAAIRKEYLKKNVFMPKDNIIIDNTDLSRPEIEHRGYHFIGKRNANTNEIIEIRPDRSVNETVPGEIMGSMKEWTKKHNEIIRPKEKPHPKITLPQIPKERFEPDTDAEKIAEHIIKTKETTSRMERLSRKLADLIEKKPTPEKLAELIRERKQIEKDMVAEQKELDRVVEETSKKATKAFEEIPEEMAKAEIHEIADLPEAEQIQIQAKKLEKIGIKGEKKYQLFSVLRGVGIRPFRKGDITELRGLPRDLVNHEHGITLAEAVDYLRQYGFDFVDAVELKNYILAEKSNFKLHFQNIKRFEEKFEDLFDVVAPFKRIGAEKTGIRIKTLISELAAIDTETARVPLRFSKLDYVPTRQEFAKLDLYAEYKTIDDVPGLSKAERNRLRPAHEIIRNYYDKFGKILTEEQVIKVQWPDSYIKYLRMENARLRDTLERPRIFKFGKKRQRTSIEKEIQANEKLIDLFEKSNLQFVPIQFRVYLEDMIQRLPPTKVEGFLFELSRATLKPEQTEQLFRSLQENFSKEGIEIDNVTAGKLARNISERILEGERWTINRFKRDLARDKVKIPSEKAERIFSAIPWQILGRDIPTKEMVIDIMEKQGILKKEDLDARETMAIYGRYAGNKLAMKRVLDQIMEDGLAKLPQELKAEEQYWSDISSIVPEFAGLRAHPAVADYFIKFNKALRTGDIWRAFALVKMFQFYNPFFLGLYDLFQAAAAGTFAELGKPKGFGELVKASFKSVYNKDASYMLAAKDGLFSTPYRNPFSEWKKDLTRRIEAQNDSHRIGRVILEKIFEGISPKHPIQSLKQIIGKGTMEMYNANWRTAWYFDQVIRMMTYGHLLKKGNTSLDAAQVAAKFHSDYASVPAPTRKILNKIFFTPTFKIAMTKLYGRMIADAFKVPIQLAKGEKIDKKQIQYAKGLLMSLGIMEGKHLILTKGFGTESEQWSRKYYKRVIVDGEERELTMTFANPLNVWIRWWFRFVNPPKTKDDQLLSRLSTMRWELHPVWQLAVETTLLNEKNNFEDLRNPLDSTSKQIADTVLYSARRVLAFLKPLLGEMGKGERQVEAYNAFKEEMAGGSGFLTWAAENFIFMNTRNIKEKRIKFLIDNINSELKKTLKKRDITIEEELKYIERAEKKIRDLEKELIEEFSK